MIGKRAKPKRVTSQDVANLAGVSRTTVSLVLNNVQGFKISRETREKVLGAADALGYVPDSTAQALASRRTKAIGLVMTRSPQHIATDAFLPQIISGMLTVVRKNDLRLLIESVDAEHQEEAYLELALAKRIDGMILSTPRIDDTALRSFERVEIPVVLLGHIPTSRLHSVDVDNRAAARSAVDYLIGLGHRQIACITNASSSYTAASSRVQGYRDALQAAGIEIDPNLILYADFEPASGYDRMKSLLDSKKKFTAAFVASDGIAIGAKAALREAGLRVPDDVSMVGFDDIPWARYSDPPLTTVRLPVQQLAYQSCMTLINILKGEEIKTQHLLLDTELIVRDSCKAI